jgi:peptide/nickel transport system substrate-binding protein
MKCKNKLLIVVVTSLLIIISNISGCVSQNEGGNAKSPVRDSLIIAIMEPVHGFYPNIHSYDVVTMMINMNIFNSLVEFDQILRTKPKLAISWNNPDDFTWRFYLREDVKFHNGYNFTAEDVKFTIDFIKNNESHVLKNLLTSIEEVKIVNNYTVDIITEKPCPILLNKLVDIPIASKRYIEEKKDDWPIGTGAYKLVDYNSSEYIELERNKDYWEELEVENVTFKIICDDEEIKNLTSSGQIDIASRILPKYYDELSNCSDMRVGRCNQATVFYLGFDFRTNNSAAYEDGENPLSDVRVRKAIYYAINITDIIDNVLNGTNFAEPASQFVSPMIFGYNPNIERLTYDIDSAKQLLKDAGYENGFELFLDIPRDAENQKKIGYLIQDHLLEIIDVKLNLISIEEWYAKIMEKNTSCYMLGWLAATGDGGEIYDYILRTVDPETGIGTYNIGYYSNPEIDIIGENVSYILDPEDRLDLMQQGFKIAMDDVAWIPLYIPKCIYALADDIAWEPGPGMLIAVEDIRFKQ